MTNSKQPTQFNQIVFMRKEKGQNPLGKTSNSYYELFSDKEHKHKVGDMLSVREHKQFQTEEKIASHIKIKIHDLAGTGKSTEISLKKHMKGNLFESILDDSPIRTSDLSGEGPRQGFNSAIVYEKTHSDGTNVLSITWEKRNMHIAEEREIFVNALKTVSSNDENVQLLKTYSDSGLTHQNGIMKVYLKKNVLQQKKKAIIDITAKIELKEEHSKSSHLNGSLSLELLEESGSLSELFKGKNLHSGHLSGDLTKYKMVQVNTQTQTNNVSSIKIKFMEDNTAESKNQKLYFSVAPEKLVSDLNDGSSRLVKLHATKNLEDSPVASLLIKQEKSNMPNGESFINVRYALNFFKDEKEHEENNKKIESTISFSDHFNPLEVDLKEHLGQLNINSRTSSGKLVSEAVGFNIKTSIVENLSKQITSTTIQITDFLETIDY